MIIAVFCIHRERKAVMTKDEWNAVLETESATPKQVGVVRREFERLGFKEVDRAERLAISAALVGLDSLTSTKDLTMGQAGKLYSTLIGVANRDELQAAARIGDADDGPGGPTLCDLIRLVAVRALSSDHGF
jgi:hypothetical protein